MLTVRDLRRQWKPQKERLASLCNEHPTAIRFHRACSWLGQVELLDLECAADQSLVHCWVALNALYGQWDSQLREPAADRQSWKRFMERIHEIDDGQHLAKILVENRNRVLKILKNEYLNRYFWSDSGANSPMRYRRAAMEAQFWFHEKRWTHISDQLLDRIYFLRCQVVHGASTYGSQLNRSAITECATMLQGIVIATLQVWIENGADIDWGPMCYPPNPNGA
ncbi:MAG: HEPN domain-containing protein [Pirellulaceae bacterium]|nr:HEPN domain-containing protein [Pirellulaceae bacterium]